MLAKEAAVNLFQRDLSDFYAPNLTQWASLPSEPINALVAERKGSASVLAQMCAEFNWIASHEAGGIETVMPFLDEVGSTTYDFDVTNAQIVSGTFSGLRQTGVEDLITLPTISRSWTQIDGYRKTANVPSLTTDPGIVNTGNIDQYAPGFDSSAQGVEAYNILHQSHASSGISQSGEIEYQFTSDIQGLLIDSGRLRWGQCEKTSRPSVFQTRMPRPGRFSGAAFA